MIHPASIVETREIGAGTTVGAFTHVAAGARIGRDCIIHEHVVVDCGAVIGNRVVIHSGGRVPNGVTLEDGVELGPNATLVSHHFATGERGAQPAPTLIGQGAAIGANATVLPGVTVGPHAIVGAGAVVTHNVPPGAIVAGNPARITGYVGAVQARAPVQLAPAPEQTGAFSTRVRGVTLHNLPLVKDLRGCLSIGETARHVPFEIKRFFLVFHVEDQRIRGEHAHRTLEQFLICVHGSCHFVADDGEAREEFVLDRPNLGLYVPAMIWGVQYKYSADGVLLVLASAHYDPQDYIRDYSDFLALAGRTRS